MFDLARHLVIDPNSITYTHLGAITYRFMTNGGSKVSLIKYGHL